MPLKYLVKLHEAGTGETSFVTGDFCECCGRQITSLYAARGERFDSEADALETAASITAATGGAFSCEVVAAPESVN